MKKSHQKSISEIILDILLLIILLAGAYFRFVGWDWGENQYLHPDERFLVWVGTDISPVDSISQYFDTSNSSLNPNNRGHGFYVYGTFPLFLTRYIVEWVYGHSGFGEMTTVGRLLSAFFDLLTVFVIYLIGSRLYKRKIGVLAAAFSAATVLQIQHAHFFTMDTFMLFFLTLAFYFAVQVLTDQRIWQSQQKKHVHSELISQNSLPSTGITPPAVDAPNQKQKNKYLVWIKIFLFDPLFLPSIGFGIALGLGVASKLNAAPIALMLPIAMILGLTTMPKRERDNRAVQTFVYLILAAFTSLLIFRIFQPYAFSGPTFFGIKPNPAWVNNLKELKAQSSGNVDFPPAMQWTRRSVFFSGKNLILWGLGLPFGILAFTGFFWIGFRLLTKLQDKDGIWQRHLLILSWVGFYFTWQSFSHTPSLRYQLPVYPMLAVFAAWTIDAIYTKYKTYQLPRKKANANQNNYKPKRKTKKVILLFGGFLGLLSLLLTVLYAYGFSQIYVRPITRIDASRWVYQNIPGAINFHIQTNEGTYNQPIPYPYSYTITAGIPYTYNLVPKVDGLLTEVFLPKVIIDNLSNHSDMLQMVIIDPVDNTNLASSSVELNTESGSPEQPQSITFLLEKPLKIFSSQNYIIQLAIPGERVGIPFTGNVTLQINSSNHYSAQAQSEKNEQHIDIPPGIIQTNQPLSFSFSSEATGDLNQLILVASTSDSTVTLPSIVHVALMDPNQDFGALESEAKISLLPGEPRQYLVKLENPLSITIGGEYIFSLDIEPSSNSLSLRGAGLANEGEWDDGLPLRIDGYDGFGGIYPPDLNFNMYWDDTPEKLERFINILDQSDYILISSSRQWGSLPRIPERFPMTTVYYRNLLGCPDNLNIEYCYNIAVPGKYQSKLGFDLIKVFTSEPSLGFFHINDQFSEEAFTVYDHPKVFVFKKSANYKSQEVYALLSNIDFTKVMRIPPMQMPPHPANLLLPMERLIEQRTGGTWSELFNLDSLINKNQFLTVIIWYLVITLLGIISFPIIHLALPGLLDGGYPLARTTGLLIVSYLSWLAGSLRIPYSRTTISIAISLLFITSIIIAIKQWDELKLLIKSRKRYFLIIELLAIAFFIAFLLIRFGNPDLWHPWKGGEKPMDFAYFNAILKSTSFPPYDPWYAGGYLNYYYFGFVFMGTLVKWLGIIPSVAYNLILPTIFSLLGLSAFSISWNIYNRFKKPNQSESPKNKPYSLIVGFAGAVGMVVLGNLGTVRMIFQGYQRIVAPGGNLDGVSFLTHLIWSIRGFFAVLSGAVLPYGIGDWYWLPSRAIPAPGDIEPITEFPYFTLLYGDPHAHLFAIPITLLVIGFVISVIFSHARWKSTLGLVFGYLFGGLAIGALRPTNTWDFYPYLILALVALGYALMKYYQPTNKLIRTIPITKTLSISMLRTIITILGFLLLAGITILLFKPYTHWYAFAYTKINFWKGTHTPLSAYLTHWCLFLFIIISWMSWETLDWMATTPVSHLRKLVPHKYLISFTLLLFLVTIIVLTAFGVKIAWFVLLIAAWAGILLIRPNTHDNKRIILVFIGTALMVTLMVEIIVLVGDIGRMNTVFKFYLQAWTLFAISTAVSFGWILSAMPKWKSGWQTTWSIGMILLLTGTALYPVMGTMAKIKDRMTTNAPHTLDGMKYMEYSSYGDAWGVMDLNQDYQAIRWMQENIQGSPVIVEANLRNLYHWGSRFSIYTGLPGVVGWEWHEQQQRATIPPTWITERILEIDNFYQTASIPEAAAFLKKYDVQYFVLGQQERGHYPGTGLEKFEIGNGLAWQEVFRYKDTIIYKVTTQ